jgi:hypothetical protein
MVPLIDVREWMRSAAGISVARNTRTRMEPAAWTVAMTAPENTLQLSRI